VVPLALYGQTPEAEAAEEAEEAEVA